MNKDTNTKNFKQGTLSSSILSMVYKDILPSKIAEWQNTQEIRQITFNGTSMLPLLKNGDILTVQFGYFEILDKGDIVLFFRNDTLFAHRILREVASECATVHVYLEIGDNGLYAKEITSDTIVGKVTGFTRTDLHISVSSDTVRVYINSLLKVQEKILSIKSWLPKLPFRDYLLVKTKYLLLKHLQRKYCSL